MRFTPNVPQIVPTGSGLQSRQVIASHGDVVTLQEVWQVGTSDCPFCMWPRGTRPAQPFVQRTVPMFRSEAVKLGLMR